jgi:hypothetical protein
LLAWRLAQKSPFAPVAKERLEEIFGIRWFEWALEKFLVEQFPDHEIDMLLDDRFSVFPKATQIISDDLTSTNVFTDIVHASPHSSLSRLQTVRKGSKFDTVLIQKTPTPPGTFSYGMAGV